MKQKGYVLVEVLVAGVLFSMAGSALCAGLIQGVKAEQIIRKSWKTYDPLRVLWIRLEKDLRSSIVLRSYPFKGSQDELSFPVLKIETDSFGGKIYRLSEIRYFIKDGILIRSEQPLSTKLVKEEPKENIVLREAKTAKFLYSYLDAEEKIEFKNFWLEAPYYGIPRAVKIETETSDSGVLITKLIALPQGKWGHFQVESQKEIAHAV
jgi:hypothetical protein